MGEEDVFPHVGRNTMLRIPGARREVYPIVTGTFGGVDFLHSVTGECRSPPNPLVATGANNRQCLIK